MKNIKAFKTFEATVNEIDPTRLTEITDDLTSAISDLSKYRDKLINYSKELSNFQNKSDEKGNDQIDDAVLNLAEAHDDIEAVIAKIDSINSVLGDYSDKGRQYLYTGK
jgi:hypothetical protein